MQIEPGGVREMHWHPASREWRYYLSGQGLMTVFASGDNARTFDYQAGAIGYVLQSMGHCIENTGTQTLRFLEMVVGPRFPDVSLQRWMALVPPETGAAAPPPRRRDGGEAGQAQTAGGLGAAVTPARRAPAGSCRAGTPG